MIYQCPSQRGYMAPSAGDMEFYQNTQILSNIWAETHDNLTPTISCYSKTTIKYVQLIMTTKNKCRDLYQTE